MNQDQFMSLVRTGLAITAGYAIGHGINDQLWGLISGAVLALAPLLWGYFSHTTNAKVVAVEEMNGVKEIVMKPTASKELSAMVDDRNRPKVVAQL